MFAISIETFFKKLKYIFLKKKKLSFSIVYSNCVHEYEENI